MIVVVKKPNYKKIAAKGLSIAAVVGMFVVYYQHMGEEVVELERNTQETLDTQKLSPEEKRAKAIEKIIFKEAETIVDMLGQKNIQKVAVVGRRLLIVCDTQTEIEPVMVRYGVLALIKNSNKDIKIAIELKNIVESRYEKQS